MFVATKLRLTDFTTKWGHVIVRDASGNVVRQHCIPTADVLDIMRSATGHPECCTDAEWASGMVEVIGRALLPGQAYPEGNGGLRINCGMAGDGATFRLNLWSIPAGQWALTGEVVRLAPHIAAQIRSNHGRYC